MLGDTVSIRIDTEELKEDLERMRDKHGDLR